MRFLPLFVVVLIFFILAPVQSAVINPSVESQPWYCRNSLTKWMCERDTPAVATDLSRVYPVGTIFITMSNKNPSVLLGFGTWQRISHGRVLFGQKDGDTSFLTANQTGGNYTQNISAHKVPT